MTEISYITQNGEQINLKDAKGRELLETKQSKLKAGNGISIAADGTISATGVGGGEKAFADLTSVEWNDYIPIMNGRNLFKKGHRYKATLYLDVFESARQSLSNVFEYTSSDRISKVKVHAALQQGALGYYNGQNPYNSEEKTHMGVSGWSPEAINICGNAYAYNGSDETKEPVVIEQGDLTFEYLTNPIELGEFEYTYNDYGNYLSDWNVENNIPPVEGTDDYIADEAVLSFHFTAVRESGEEDESEQGRLNANQVFRYSNKKVYIIFEEIK